MVEGKDNIKDLFSEKLAGYEANVRPEMWANISSQIGVTSGAVATGGLSILAKAIIGISVAASIVGISVVVINNKESKNKQAENTVITEEKSVVPEEVEKEIIDNPESVITEQIDESIKENSSPLSDENTIENDKSETSTPLIKDNFIYEEKKQVKSPVSVKEIKPEIIIEDIVALEEIEDRIENVKEEESVVLQDLPNVFTPNGDNVNDFLSIETKGLTDFSIVVLDQKSAIVYKSNEPDFVWNGTGMNGDIVPAGNYVYYITARDAKGNLISRHSTLRIER